MGGIYCILKHAALVRVLLLIPLFARKPFLPCLCSGPSPLQWLPSKGWSTQPVSCTHPTFHKFCAVLQRFNLKVTLVMT